jgi:hypothetical protein
MNARDQKVSSITATRRIVIARKFAFRETWSDALAN